MRISFEKDKLKLWSAVCIISAIPSFYWALEVKANITAMLVGIALFIFGYTAITSSGFYKKQKQKIFWFVALKWAFRIRVFYSLLSIVTIILFVPNSGNLENTVFWTNIIDGWLGLVSIAITQFIFGNGVFLGLYSEQSSIPPNVDFIPTVLTTITQGILLSLLILLIAVIIWCFFRVRNIVSQILYHLTKW